MFRLLLITEGGRRSEPLPALVAEALSGAVPGSTAVQLREKQLAAHELAALASALLPICRARGAPLLINDRLDLALTLGLDGVHLPERSFAAADARQLLPASAWLGVSCHSPESVRAAREGGASYATFGPVFVTSSKRVFGAPLGLSALCDAAQLGLPLVGLGGITAENAPSVLASGAAGLAVIGAWLDARHPGEAVSRLLAV